MSAKRRGCTPSKRSGSARALGMAVAAGVSFGLSNHVDAAPGDAGVPSRPPPTTTARTGFNGTAYLKTTNTLRYTNKPYGLSGAVGRAMVNQCNGIRQGFYRLPPVSPNELVIAALDVKTEEKFFDTNKALTLITGEMANIPDLERWKTDQKSLLSSGQLPANPPDCSKLKPLPVRNGTLWRDGVIYTLRYDTSKAIGRKVTARPPPAGFKAAFDAAVPTLVLGQTCREIVGTADMAPGSRSCIWDLFPYVSYLNWPFVLSGRIPYGFIPDLIETIVPVTIEHDRAIPASTFEIPPGFTVVPP